MKAIKKIVSTLLALSCLAGITVFSGCSSKEKVVIYTSAEEYRVDYNKKRLQEQFPNYDIVIEYMSSGNHAAKLFAEGKATECDITYDLEYPYLEQLAQKKNLADLSSYDFSAFTENVVASKYYIPELVNSAAIIINPKVLADKGLEKPKSYDDLLKPEYKGLISMPNPKSSGTGYMTLKAYVNQYGEEAAFTYFDKLAQNVLSFTSSGSGPVNALIQNEVAIGLGMTAQAVTAINDGANLEVYYFEEGAPYSTYGQAIISGKETRPAVKEVFDFMVNTLNAENNEKFYPEKIFKDKVNNVKNYPADIKYADMKNNTNEEKERLLEKWKY